MVLSLEPGMLYDPGMSSSGDQQYVAEVVTHELAHMVRIVR